MGQNGDSLSDMGQRLSENGPYITNGSYGALNRSLKEIKKIEIFESLVSEISAFNHTN